MKTRRLAYSIAMLASAVLTLVPAILWMDFVVPFSGYEVWQRRDKELVFRISGDDGTIVELAGSQPSRLAMEYAAVAFPTWALLFVLCYELRRRASRNDVAGAVGGGPVSAA